MRVKSTTVWPASIGLLATFCMALHAEAQFQQDKGPAEWRSDLSVYLWITSIQGESTVGDVELPLDLTFSDIWADLKFAMSLHYELGKGQWGGILDFTYIKMGKDGIPLMEPPGVTVSYNFEIVATELIGTYRLGPELGPQRFELLLGARYNRQQLDLVPESGPAPLPPGGGFDENWVDPLVGARWIAEFGNDRRWRTRVRADVGGVLFGSDFVFNSLAGIGYRFSHWFSLDAAYRYMYTDYKTGTEGMADYWAYKADQSGLVLGATFTF